MTYDRCLAWIVLAAVLAGCAARASAALGEDPFVDFTPVAGDFPLAADRVEAPLCADPGDWPGVLRAAGDLRADVARVTGRAPALALAAVPRAPAVVLIGTLGRSRLIDDLVRRGKLDPAPIAGKWEAFVREVVENPLPGVARALVIAGSDQRGTIYGIYDVSEAIGVSPWYWWDDVPVAPHAAVYVRPGRHVEGPPAVKYRGIFLNDEAPTLTGWVREKFGDYNHEFYAHIFELLLRLRANYLWPAMWHNSFDVDDPRNPELASAYGIVMGTSHVEPMMRADQEWGREGHTAAEWNYATHSRELDAFWREGIVRTRPYGNLITIGMRGKIDTPMSPTTNIPLLERIVADQRRIIAEVLHADPTRVPQVWALYKEVQDYYDQGMRVPDDVTLLWSDDNWGDLRRLPTPAERGRAGGAGIYYHLDYVGAPRNYRWLDTVPLPKMWEQLHLAWKYGADRIWIVNVGPLKGKEVPTEFFLRYAWAPDRWPVGRLDDYLPLWAAREFGPGHAPEIAALVAGYTKLNGLRKPELLAPDTFSLVNYREAEGVLANWAALALRARRLYAVLPAADRDAYFELVLYPVVAGANLNEFYVAVGRNRLYAAQGRASAGAQALRALALFRNDAEFTREYNHLENGRWDPIIDQPHIGYTSWQSPKANVMPAVRTPEVPPAAALGVAVEGSIAAWPGVASPPVLPPLGPRDPDPRTISVFDRGATPLAFSAATSAPWLHVTPDSGVLGPDATLAVTADWARVPPGTRGVSVTITGADGRAVTVAVPLGPPIPPDAGGPDAFVETDGCVAIEAAHYARAVAAGGIHWQVIPDYGRTLSGVTAFPVAAASTPPGPGSARLEYAVWLSSSGPVTVDLVVAPTMNFTPGRGLRAAVSFDDAPPQTVDFLADRSESAWERAVRDNDRVAVVHGQLDRPGAHVLKFWRIDPGVVLERIVIDAGGVRPSYLGPPESPRGAAPGISQ